VTKNGQKAWNFNTKKEMESKEGRNKNDDFSSLCSQRQIQYKIQNLQIKMGFLLSLQNQKKQVKPQKVKIVYVLRKADTGFV
jgi:hypothetical protein